LGNRIAKRTFGTTVTLLNRVLIENVPKMPGHTNIRTAQLYAKVSEDMVPLMGKFVAQHTKANPITDSKISIDIALIRKKTIVPHMEEAYY